MGEKDDKYNRKNKEKRLAWAKSKKICHMCGKIYRASHKWEHERTNYHKLVKQCREYIKNLVIT